jgi:hypothetical protein
VIWGFIITCISSVSSESPSLILCVLIIFDKPQNNGHTPEPVLLCCGAF